MKSFQLSLIFFNVIAVFWCKVGIVEGIIGGRDAKHSEIKYQVSIRENGLHICNGAIISPQHVLSVAHCFINSENEFIIKTRKDIRYTVLAGVINESDKVATRVEKSVAKIYIPDGFAVAHDHEITNTFKDDIAVVQVYSVLYEVQNTGIAKVGLPVQLNTDAYKNSKLIVSGYGFVFPPIRSKSETTTFVKSCKNCDKLKLIEANVISNEDCLRINKNNIENNVICARVSQKSALFSEATCEGDSGAPLVLNGNLLIGVLSSHTIRCTERQYPATYTNVDNYRNFITKAMRNGNLSGIRVQQIFRRKA